jgi:hypothetical protein
MSLSRGKPIRECWLDKVFLPARTQEGKLRLLSAPPSHGLIEEAHTPAVRLPEIGAHVRGLGPRRVAL